MGPEPYSLAIVLKENMGNMMFRNVKIHATDIDLSNQFSKVITTGTYHVEQLKSVPSDILTKYFTRNDDAKYYTIAEEIRKALDFERHDLLTLKPARTDCSLIMCKNVLLHFTPQERIDVIRMFHDSLEDGGYFVTEQTQKLPDACRNLFDQVVSNAQLFRKKSTTG
jgi:chemotaxis protein methyltransferase CheR